MHATLDAEKLRTWAASDEGRTAIREAVKRAGRAADRFKKARQIPLDLWLRPMTR